MAAMIEMTSAMPGMKGRICQVRFVITCSTCNVMYTMLQKLSKWEEGLTLLKFDHFTATPILQEIKFW